MSGKPSIFISHTNDESELAIALKEFIGEAFPDLVGVYVSSDRRSVKAGDRWLADLGMALELSDLHIALCSPASIGRPWVNFEAGAAWIKATPILPFCHSGLSPDALPLPLNTFHAVRLGSRHALDSLVSRVGQVVGADERSVELVQWEHRIRAIEKRIEAGLQARRRIADPRILCGTIPPFAESLQADVAAIRRSFGNVVERSDLDAPALVHTLSTERFDILHLFVPVDPDSGDVLFAPLETGDRTGRLPASAFRDLVESSGASLVVLATCKAVLLAIQVAPTCNMVACDIAVQDDQMDRWNRLFYPLLASGRTLSSAFRTATQSSSVPMFHLRSDEVVFESRTSPVKAST